MIPRDPPRGPDETPLTLGSALTVAGIAAAVLSVESLTHLAELAVYPGHSAWLLPISSDALAVSAWWAHRYRRDPVAGWIGLVVTGVSMLANAVSHLVIWGSIAMNAGIVAACAVTPPACVATCIYLARPRGRHAAAAESVAPAVDAAPADETPATEPGETEGFGLGGDPEFDWAPALLEPEPTAEPEPVMAPVVPLRDPGHAYPPLALARPAIDVEPEPLAADPGEDEDEPAVEEECAVPTPPAEPEPAVSFAGGDPECRRQLEAARSTDDRVALVLDWARRDGVKAIVPLREAYGCSWNVAKVASNTLRDERAPEMAGVSS